jgi:copper chaperone CopZ
VVKEANIKVLGMKCGGCVSSVTAVLRELPGVAEVAVSLEQGEARVVFDDSAVGVESFRAVIADAGFDTD